MTAPSLHTLRSAPSIVRKSDFILHDCPVFTLASFGTLHRRKAFASVDLFSVGDLLPHCSSPTPCVHYDPETFCSFMSFPPPSVSSSPSTPPPMITENPNEIPIVNKNEKLNSEKCQSIYRNTLSLLHSRGSDPIESQAYLRELWETSGCDHFSDLSDIRDNVRGKVGNELVERVVSPKGGPTQEDLVEVYNVVSHYQLYHKKRLFACFTPSTKLSYYWNEEIQRTAAVLTSIAFLFGGYEKVAPSVSGTWRQYFPTQQTKSSSTTSTQNAEWSPSSTSGK